jgi:hypothetical protein
MMASSPTRQKEPTRATYSKLTQCQLRLVLPRRRRGRGRGTNTFNRPMNGTGIAPVDALALPTAASPSSYGVFTERELIMVALSYIRKQEK